jgi:hypothetical protein
MPSRKAAPPPPAKPATRRCRLVGASYSSFRLGPDGRVNETVEWAEFGDEIALSATEEIRLDLLSALARPNSTFEDVVAEKDRREQAYRSARRELAV